MRKILFIILIALLAVGAGFIISDGLELGDFQVWGIKDIIAQDENIDNKNAELSNLVSVSYPNTLQNLESSSQTLASTKKDYEDKSILVSNNRYYMQTEKYEIEYLWTKLGNYAKDNSVEIKIDVVSSGTEKLYDLKFTIAGTYVDVTDFIYDIENDSKLGFKIEDFHMAANGEGVQGSFTCKEISIKLESVGESIDQTEETESRTSTTEETTNEVENVETNKATTEEQTTNEVGNVETTEAQ